jgi:hypothetical protein
MWQVVLGERGIELERREIPAMEMEAVLSCEEMINDSM